MKKIISTAVALVLIAGPTLASSIKSFDFEGVVTGSDNSSLIYPQVGEEFTGYFAYNTETLVDLPDSPGLYAAETAFEFNFENSTVYKPMGYGIFADMEDLVFLDYPHETSPDYYIEDWYTSLGPDGGSFLMVAGIDYMIEAHITGNFNRVGTENQPVPEPATMLLVGVGLLGFAMYKRRKT